MNFLEKVKILQNHYKAGNFLKVIEGCKALDKKFPENSFVLNLSGMAFQGLNKHQKAIALFELALKADNFNIAAMNNLANSLKHTEQFERADQIFKKILKINPNYINAYNNYANLKTEVNDVEGAIKLYKEAILIAKKSKIDPTNFLTHLAVSLQSMNMKEELIEIIDEILNINQDNINAHKILSTFYKYSPEDKKTIDHINHMEKIFQKNNLSDDQRGLIAFALGKAYDDIKNFPLAFKFLSIGNNFYKIRITQPPLIYSRRISQYMDFAFRKAGYHYLRREVSSILFLENSVKENLAKFKSTHRTAVRKAEKSGIIIRQTEDYENFYKILKKNLSIRHDVSPTHSLLELLYLKELFPDKINLFGAYLKNEMIAGVINFVVNDRIVLAFYISHKKQYQELRPINLLFYKIFDWAICNNFKVFDFGIFTVHEKPNMGLARFKENFGASGVFRDTVELTFS